MTLQINDYRMKGDALVRITDLDGSRYGIQNVIVLVSNGVEVVAGSSGWVSMDTDFTAVTDPKLIAASKAFEANRHYEEMDKAVDVAWTDVQKWKGVLQCILEGNLAGATA